MAEILTRDVGPWAAADPDLVALVAGGMPLEVAYDQVERLAIIDSDTLNREVTHA